MAKKAFITGVSGFAGGYLASELLNSGYEVGGTYLTPDSLRNLSDIKGRLNLIQVDLTEREKVFEIVRREKPEYIFHLAALSSAIDSFTDPWRTITNNVEVEITLLEAIRRAEIKPRILVVSSADVYGLVASSDLPIDEHTVLLPNNPYSVSKLSQDFLGLQYAITYDMDIVRVRPFNHIGPRQAAQFVVSSFAKQIAEIEKKKKEPTLHVGNLEPKRDFTDVRDMVVAYRLILEKGKAKEVYNIGSGISHSIQEVLAMLLKNSSENISVKQEKKLMRPSDTTELICDARKLQEATGWVPTIELGKTLKDTLDYWRAII